MNKSIQKFPKTQKKYHKINSFFSISPIKLHSNFQRIQSLERVELFLSQNDSEFPKNNLVNIERAITQTNRATTCMPVNPNSQTVFEMDCHPYMTSQSFINGTTGQPPCYQKQFNGQDTVLIPSISSPIMSTSVESSLQNNLPAMHCSSQRNIAGAINQPPYYQQQLNTECTVLISSISSPITSNFINISSKNHLSQRQYLSKQNININTPSTYDPLDVKFSPTDVIFLSNDDEWPLNLPIGPYFQDKPILKCIQKRFMKIHRPYYIKRIPQQLVSIVTTCQCDDCKNDENEKLTTHHDSFDQSTPTHDLPPPDLKSSPKNVIIATNDYEWPSNDNNTMTPINSFPWKSPYPTDLSTLKSNKISYIEATSQDMVQISSIDLIIIERCKTQADSPICINSVN